MMSRSREARDQGATTIRYVLDFRDLDRTQAAIGGGKGAGLGELSRIEGVRVRAGFCMTTDAFRRAMHAVPSIDERIDALSRLDPSDHAAVRTLSADIRRRIEETALPDDVADAIARSIASIDAHAAYAVRSSATAEDLPAASFAGQHDTYLNVIGADAVTTHVRRCWASLFTERAATYRIRNGIDSRAVGMAVVVQRMALPRVSGIAFTADPLTGHRKTISIEASLGLGEALVSGLVNADAYKVRDGAIVARSIGTKAHCVEALPSGGTEERAVDPERQRRAALTDDEILRLAALARRIETHFGDPQDIEWCLAGDEFEIVQSRPITTLFPVPATSETGNRVYISTGHQQMMTDAHAPLGISVRQMTAAVPMYEAGGRLFVDATRALSSPATREGLLAMIGRSDPLIGSALQTIIGRGDFLPSPPDASSARTPPAPATLETDPAIVAGLIANARSSNAKLRREIRTRSGPELLDFILADFAELKRVLFDPRSHQAIMAGMEAAWRLNDAIEEWLGEKNAADVLAQSVPNNVTSEMGLDLLRVADAIRPHADVVRFLQNVGDDDFLGALPDVAGGRRAKEAIDAWLDRYGMRCLAEIQWK